MQADRERSKGSPNRSLRLDLEACWTRLRGRPLQLWFLRT